MNKKAAILFLFALFSGLFSHAAGLPSVPAEQNITVGKFANGITYYVAKNPDEKGLLDIAVIEKTDSTLSLESATAAATHWIHEVRMPNGADLEGFLRRNGVAPSRGGYVQVRDGAILYDFKGFSLARKQDVLDSLTLMLFKLLDVSEGQPTSSQALVFSGDIDTEKFIDRIKLASMSNGERDGMVVPKKYVWNPEKPYTIDVQKDGRPCIRVEWREARPPREYMSSILPVISAKMSGEFLRLLTERLRVRFDALNMDVRMESRYRGSESGPSDDVLGLVFRCKETDLMTVKTELETEINRLYTYGAGAQEYAFIKDAFRNAWTFGIKQALVPNSLYTKRCTANFLYGTTLASEDVKFQMACRPVPEDIMLDQFNAYMSELLDRTAVKDTSLAVVENVGDFNDIENALVQVRMSLCKIRKEAYDNATGGKMWTMENGVTVIYKKCETSGLTYCSYSGRGGRKWADEKNFKTIAGESAAALSRYMQTKGISLDVAMGQTDVRLEGKALDSNLDEVMRLLVALSTKEENSKVFASGCFKLLVIATDLDEQTVKAKVQNYASSFGPGSVWRAGVEVVPNSEETRRGKVRSPQSKTQLTTLFTVPRSSAGYAALSVFKIALEDELNRSLYGKGVHFSLDVRPLSFPSENVLMTIRAENLPQGAMPEGNVSCNDLKAAIYSVVRRLSLTPLSPDRLELYKEMSRNAHSSVKSTPTYYIEVANDRYLYNRDMVSRFDSCTKTLIAEELMTLYALALSGTR